jgi:creatinine amidohydrolase
MTGRRADHGFSLPNTTTDNEAVHAPVAVIPVGSFEQHGPYLPLVTDTLIATTITDAISRDRPVFQHPPITFGCSHEHTALPGTVEITATTLAAVIGDITTSLAQQGINVLIMVNGPGGNYFLGRASCGVNGTTRSRQLGRRQPTLCICYQVIGGPLGKSAP